MKAADAVIAWTPAAWEWKGPDTVGRVIVCGNPPRSAVDGFALWLPVTFGADEEFTSEQAKLAAFIAFNTLTVRDGMDPQVVHAAMLAIEEYRDGLSPDTPTKV